MHEAWITRSFPFDHPVERIGALRSRLRGVAARIATATRGLSGAARARRDGDAWSIQEHVGHLHDLDALHLARLEQLARGDERLQAADMSNRATWDADHNARAFDAVLDAFDARRRELLRRLDALGPDGLARAARHPRLDQPMRAVDVACFAAEHDDHHLARLEALADAARRDDAPGAAVSTPWCALPDDAPMDLLERRRVVGEQAMISHITLHRGCQVPSHAHENEQFACVLSGRVRFTLAGGERRELGAGEVLHLPPFAPHAAEALETAVVLDVFAPPSERTGVDR